MNTMGFIQYIIDIYDVLLFFFLQRNCFVETFSYNKESFDVKVTDVRTKLEKLLKRLVN